MSAVRSRTFLHQTLPSRVVFGRGSINRLAEEASSLGIRNPLVLTTPVQRDLGERCMVLLGGQAVGIFDQARMHVPVEIVAKGHEAAQRLGADGLIAAGGGSTIGLAKGMALQGRLPILALPTTYAGSEMTPIFGLTEGGIKKTGRDAVVAPRSVIYDPDLLDGLPRAIAVVSGFNAMAHACEALYARDGSPIDLLIAEEGVRAVFAGLQRLDGPDAADARGDCLYGAWLCGTVLGSVGMALHHKLCHTLGGTLDLPHAETHTVVLPHALAYNAAAAPGALAAIGRAIGDDDAPFALHQSAAALGAPTALRDLGMMADDVERVVELALASPYWNPRPLEADALRGLLQRAWAGEPPRS